MDKPLPKIALAAVLKPVDDPRMFEKFAQTLHDHFEVHILGFASSNRTPPPQNIHFHPIFDFTRTNTSRLHASKVFLQTIKRIKPDVLIVHAVELLPAACWYAFRQAIPLCYDVRENYWRNIIYQNNYHSLLKLPLALSIRCVEWLSRLVVQHYFLAEKCYAHETSFSTGKQTVLENTYKAVAKLALASRQRPVVSKLKFVYTGTISTIYGAKEAFMLMERLNSNGTDLEFTMIGKIAQKHLGDWLDQQAKKHSWFQWKGKYTPVPHSELIQALASSDLSLLPYQANKSTQNCIPTKMYECLALGIPMLVQHNTMWEDLCQQYQAALFIDYATENPQELRSKLQQKHFYPNGPTISAFWDTSNKQRLLAVIKSFLK